MGWITRLTLVLVIAASGAAAQTPESLPQDQAAAGQDTVPPTAHTGWATLAKDTGRDFLSFPKRPSTWIFLAAGGALALAAHPADDYVESHVLGNTAAKRFFTPGKVIGSAAFQVGSAASLWMVGRYLVPPTSGARTNKVSHIGFDLIRAQIVSQTFVQTIKHTVRRDRPTGECCAFPSGHAASAFAAASVLERHFGYRAWWPALTAATYVGTSRLVENRHFLSDVIFGAAIGEAVGRTVVGRHGRSEYALQPVPVRGGFMVALSKVR